MTTRRVIHRRRFLQLGVGATATVGLAACSTPARVGTTLIGPNSPEVAEAESARRAAGAAKESVRLNAVTGIVDLGGVQVDTIYAATDGVVREAGAASGFGLWVKIERPDGTTTVYGHIDSYAVRVGQRVMAGDLIATVGNRGISTGPHLHFEVWEPSGRKADPLAWLQTHGVAIS